MLLLLLLVVRGPPQAEDISRPSAQPVTTQPCVHVCVCDMSAHWFMGSAILPKFATSETGNV